MTRLRLTAAAAWLVSSLICGCSSGDRPELGTVEGTVTLDGEPLARAGIIFTAEGYRPSTGLTDEQGHYELTYLRDIRGAVVGSHRVRINRVPISEGEQVASLPTRYNRESELTREVKPGQNIIDFPLESD